MIPFASLSLRALLLPYRWAHRSQQPKVLVRETEHWIVVCERLEVWLVSKISRQSNLLANNEEKRRRQNTWSTIADERVSIRSFGGGGASDPPDALWPPRSTSRDFCFGWSADEQCKGQWGKRLPWRYNFTFLRHSSSRSSSAGEVVRDSDQLKISTYPVGAAALAFFFLWFFFPPAPEAAGAAAAAGVVDFASILSWKLISQKKL